MGISRPIAPHPCQEPITPCHGNALELKSYGDTGKIILINRKIELADQTIPIQAQRTGLNIKVSPRAGLDRNRIALVLTIACGNEPVYCPSNRGSTRITVRVPIKSRGFNRTYICRFVDLQTAVLQDKRLWVCRPCADRCPRITLPDAVDMKTVTRKPTINLAHRNPLMCEL